MYDPLSDTNLRFCVDSCPTYTSTTLSVPNCYPGSSVTCPSLIGLSSSDWMQINSDGTITGSVTSSFLLYGSYSLLDRICIPNTNVFKNYLKPVMETFYNAANTGTFANFITDIINVKNIFKYIELAMAFSCFRCSRYLRFCLHVCFKMSCWMYCLGIYFWYHRILCRCWSRIFI